MTEVEKKTGMTDVECEYWDKYYTENVCETGPNLLNFGIKPGFAHSTILLSELDAEVAEYLSTCAKTFHKSQIQIINELVREKLAIGA